MCKKYLLALLVVSLFLIIDCGFKVFLIVVLGCLVGGIICILPFWLMTFVICSVMSNSPKMTWNELKPSRMFKECFLNDEK